MSAEPRSHISDDRQFVVSHMLVDTNGNRAGRYSGIIFQSTGMPHGLGKMVYDDGRLTYEGDWCHGWWHGSGRATFASGDSYEGKYQFDQRNGHGTYRWSDGRVYQGEFSENKRHGQGTMQWPNGDMYTGEFKNGQREGHGHFEFLDGGYYVGSWVDDRFEGFGELYSETGRTYKGEWRSGMAHGRGVETYPDGRIRHDGQWIENEPVDNEPRARQCYELSLPNPNRKITLKELIPLLWIYPSGRSNHSYSDVSLMSDLDDETPPKVPLMGDVTLVTLGMSEELQCRPPPRRVVSPDTALDRSNSNDENTNHRDDDVANDDNSVGNTVAASTCEDDRQMVVSHKIVDQHGARGEYSGVVLRSTGKPHGRGTMVYDDHGRTYDGDWCRGQYHGYGRATYANGNFYDGEFQFNQRHGRGKYCWPDGRVYQGEFSENKRHGQGTLQWPNGDIYTGEFKNGQREGHGHFESSDGDYYVGSWVDDRYEGFGEPYSEGGRTYEGEWRSGMAHGRGVATHPDGRIRYDELWVENEPLVIEVPLVCTTGFHLPQ